ncbi:SIMPL domain-containing protein [Thermomicrobium sp. 4228-Ro]|uniref:SIMPL domain-containing protein n=1 Tax=Thermomicrobium sp. 4228-Ro TaxID=2993937 RepID=UPI0022495243|nr:SIMPL domain-containing protein [Thermomicrobium sp. 4228-Ro]MCX2726936.1 SIMPL domain-containing protein [Thermomicrobium sp. 4228-Ro]
MTRRWLAGIVALVSLAVLGLVLNVFSSLPATDGAAAQGTATNERVISVSGEGRVTVAPDIATLTLGVEVFDRDAAVAQQAVADRMTAVLAVFRQAGIPDNSVKTVLYTISVERDWQQPAAPVTGYRVTQLIEVQVRPIDRVGPLLTEAVQAGANVVQQVSFSLANPAAALRQARELAVRDAHDKAAQLAQLTGVGLGEPVRIVESAAAPPVPVPAAREAPGAAPVPAGEAVVTVSVSIDYAIR